MTPAEFGKFIANETAKWGKDDRRQRQCPLGSKCEQLKLSITRPLIP